MINVEGGKRMNLDNYVSDLMKQEAELTARKNNAEKVIADYLEKKKKKVVEEITSLYERQVKYHIKGNLLIDIGLTSPAGNVALCLRCLIRKGERDRLYAVVVYKDRIGRNDYWTDSIWLDSGRKQGFCSIYSEYCKPVLNYLVENFDDAKEVMEQSFDSGVRNYYKSRIDSLNSDVHESEAKANEVTEREKEIAMRLSFNEMVLTLINRMEDDHYEPYGGMSTVWIYDKKTKQRFKLEITEDDD